MSAKTIREWQSEVHRLADDKGWWPQLSVSTQAGRLPVPISSANVVEVLASIRAAIPEKLALIHGEISEALECYRDDQLYEYEENGKPEGFGVELADAVIRILDLAGALGIDLQDAMEKKHAYNAARPERHGGKLA